MKHTSLIISILLFVGLAVLYVLHFTSDKNGSGEEAVQTTDVTGCLKFAYVKADSLILNYDLAQDLHDQFTKKQEAFTNEYGAKRKAFEKEATEFQQKLQRGGFLTEQRAIQERDRLVTKEQEITRLDQELSSKLAEMQQENNRQLIDSLITYLKIFNRDKKYDYILNSADILIGPETSNITQQVLKEMNARYQSSKPKK
jgi:outer membrane protein